MFLPAFLLPEYDNSFSFSLWKSGCIDRKKTATQPDVWLQCLGLPEGVVAVAPISDGLKNRKKTSWDWL